MCNIPGQAHTVDSHVYSFCGQLFPFHTSHRQGYLKKTRQLIKKESTRTQITKDCFISLHWIKLNIILSYICVVIYWEILHGLRIKTNLRTSFLYTKLKMAGVCCRMKGLYKPAKQGKTVENIHHYEKKKRRELINKHLLCIPITVDEKAGVCSPCVPV